MAQTRRPRCTTHVLLFFIAVAINVNAFAQKDDSLKRVAFKIDKRQQNYYFLQQTLNYSALSYVSPPYGERGSPRDWYWLSSDIVPQFVIGGDWMPFPIHFTPRYKVRIFHDNKVLGDSSMPVRTPSFMPGLTIHFRHSRVDDSKKNIIYTSLSIFHHSNGQDGSEFNGGNINTYNGNFSTNFFEPAIHFRSRNKRIDYLKGKPFQDKDYFDFYGRLGFEFHFATASALNSSYGNQRINLMLGLTEVIRRTDRYEENYFYRERNRFVLNATLIAGARDHGLDVFSRRINLDLNYYWRIPSSPNSAVFLSGGYYGSDSYNIFYMQSYWYVRAGLAFGFFISPVSRGNKKLNVMGIE